MSKQLFYIGTYTSDTSEGLYAYHFDATTTTIRPLGLAAKITNPSFFAFNNLSTRLYAVSEQNPQGEVSAYNINHDTGMLALINTVPSGGADPCHLSINSSDHSVVVSNYSGGNLSSYHVEADGSLSNAVSFFQHTGQSVNAARQEKSHVHSANISPNGKHVVVADLGVDKLYVYGLDPGHATLTLNTVFPLIDTQPGAGPRHSVFHPNGRFIYVINELNCTITTYGWDAESGALTVIGTVDTLPAGVLVVPEYTTAEVAVHPSGNYLFGSVRGHDSITVYRIDQESGTLTTLSNVPSGGKGPRHFSLDKTGNFLLAANQRSDNLVVFKFDVISGSLVQTDQAITVSSPVCVRFL